MTRALAAAFVVLIAGFLIAIPLATLTWFDVLPARGFGDTVTFGVACALFAQFVGVLYLAWVPVAPYRDRHSAPERPRGLLEARSFRIVVRITVSVLAVGTLLAVALAVVALFRAIGS